MADEPTETVETPPSEDPTKAELAQLRKEKQEREQADRDAKEAELEELRKYKADQEAKPTITPPKPKAEKVAEVVAPVPEVKKKARVSARWFGSSAYDD